MVGGGGGGHVPILSGETTHCRQFLSFHQLQELAAQYSRLTAFYPKRITVRSPDSASLAGPFAATQNLLSFSPSPPPAGSLPSVSRSLCLHLSPPLASTHSRARAHSRPHQPAPPARAAPCGSAPPGCRNPIRKMQLEEGSARAPAPAGDAVHLLPRPAARPPEPRPRPSRRRRARGPRALTLLAAVHVSRPPPRVLCASATGCPSRSDRTLARPPRRAPPRLRPRLPRSPLPRRRRARRRRPPSAGSAFPGRHPTT